jgi:dihydroorotase
MNEWSIKNATVVSGKGRFEANLYIKDGIIYDVFPLGKSKIAANTIDLKGDLLFPGLIDDQVHFREPGLTHKGNIATESRAAIAGGITSFMEMPNTNPPVLTQELLAQKYEIAAQTSAANYSFFMGCSVDNYDEVMKTDLQNVCGLKIFLGSSTGNLLMDDCEVLEKIFRTFEGLIAVHAEDDGYIAQRLAEAKAEFGDDIPPQYHPIIRDEEACFRSSSKAVALAERTGARLHVLHISTAKELDLFKNNLPLKDKKITAEACVHHLWFCDEDYARLGNFIKWNPAVKKKTDRDAIRAAVLDGRIDVLATDHAPHTSEEKQNAYGKAPSGGPLVQHALPALLELAQQGVFSEELIALKYAENVADLFQIDRKGRVEEGYFADLVHVQSLPNMVEKSNLLYHCGWSPFEGVIFSNRVSHTWVNGALGWDGQNLIENRSAKRLQFKRK